MVAGGAATGHWRASCGPGLSPGHPALRQHGASVRCDHVGQCHGGAVVVAKAAKAAKAVILIVLLNNPDPVVAGFVPSLARPSGNIAGALISPEGSLAAERVQLLRDLVPRATRLVLLAPAEFGPSCPQRQSQEACYRFMSVVAGNLAGFEDAARALFAPDRRQFATRMAALPADIRAHLLQLAEPAFQRAWDAGKHDA